MAPFALPVSYQWLAQSLNDLTEERFKQVVNEQPYDRVAPHFLNSSGWLAHMPYPRMLQVSDAKQTRIMLAWITYGGFNPKTTELLNSFAPPDRLEVFIQAVKESRDAPLLDKISVITIYQNKKVRKTLHPTIQKVLEIERSFLQERRTDASCEEKYQELMSDGH